MSTVVRTAAIWTLTWKIRTQIAMQRVPLWPSPSMNVVCKSLESVDRSNCGSPKRPKIQAQHMVWPMHGIVCAPISRTNASSIGTNDTVRSLRRNTNQLGKLTSFVDSFDRETQSKTLFTYKIQTMWWIRPPSTRDANWIEQWAFRAMRNRHDSTAPRIASTPLHWSIAPTQWSMLKCIHTMMHSPKHSRGRHRTSCRNEDKQR